MKKGLIEKKFFIIDYIRKFQPVSRHIMAHKFNMNRATVGNIVETLIKEKSVIETTDLQPEKDRNAGRPPIGLKLNPAAGYFIGIDMYDRRLTAVLTDFECRPLFEHQESFQEDVSPETILETMRQSIRTLLEKNGSRKKLKGIGLSLPGRINLKDGVAMEYYRIPQWRNIPFARTLQAAFKTPVFIEHNSSAVALADAWNNHPQETGVVTSILIRTGISFGIVQNREVINSGTYSAGELGHTVINLEGPLCRCGRRGCLETYASGAALARLVEEESAENPDWPGKQALKDNVLDADVICELAVNGDPACLKILQNIFHYLSIGIDTIMYLYAPDIIVINGIYNKASSLLQQVIDSQCTHALLDKTRIFIPPYDYKTGAIGAALLASTRTCNPLHHLLK